MRLCDLGSLLFLFMFAGFGEVSAVLLPHVLWDRCNPIFNNVTCPLGNRIRVRMGDRINIVCPNRVTNPIVLDNVPTTEQLYSNILLTEDAHAYANCNGTEAKELYTCDTPNDLKYYTFMFRKVAPSISSMVYKEGATYYIFATADGTSSGQGSMIGGFCGSYGVKMEIYVCKPDEDCDETAKECKGVYTGGHALGARGDDPSFADKLQDASVVSCLVGFLLIGTFIGIVIGFGFNQIKNRRESDSKEKKCCMRSNSMETKSTATSTYCGEDSVQMV